MKTYAFTADTVKYFLRSVNILTGGVDPSVVTLTHDTNTELWSRIIATKSGQLIRVDENLELTRLLDEVQINLVGLALAAGGTLTFVFCKSDIMICPKTLAESLLWGQELLPFIKSDHVTVLEF